MQKKIKNQNCFGFLSIISYSSLDALRFWRYLEQKTNLYYLKFENLKNQNLFNQNLMRGLR